MIFSIATIYPKVKNRMMKRGKNTIDLNSKKRIELINKLKKICDKYNMKIKAGNRFSTLILKTRVSFYIIIEDFQINRRSSET